MKMNMTRFSLAIGLLVFGVVLVHLWMTTTLSVELGLSVERRREQKLVVISKERKPLCGDTTARKGEWKLGTDSSGVERQIYEPDECRYHQFSGVEAAKCLDGKKLAFSGDSLIRYALRGLNRIVDPSFNIDPAYGQKEFTDTLTHHNYSYVAHYKWNPCADLPWESLLEGRWDTYLFGFGIWKMQRCFEEPAKFQTTVKEFAAAVEAREKKWGWFAMHTLPWTKCKSELCVKCYPPVRQQLWRSVSTTSVYCSRNNTRDWLVDTHEMTDNNFSYEASHDGVHFNETISSMQGQMILNWLCGDWLRTQFKQPELSPSNTPPGDCAMQYTPGDKSLLSEAEEIACLKKKKKHLRSKKKRKKR
ncbi:O-acetyltransferase [Diplonema papillatum]|nr:O-acetyltransferase [Diplonema papillatum]